MLWPIRKLSSQHIRLLGLDITSSNIKLLELLPQGKHFHIQQFGQMALPSDVMDGGHMQKVEKLSDVIQLLLVELGYRTKPYPILDAIIAVPDICTISKTITVSDRLDDRDLEELVHIELDKFIPQAKDEVYFDFKRLSGGTFQHSLKEVLIVATRMHHITQRVAALKQLGVRTRVVDIESFAIQRALPLLLTGTDQHGITVLVDLGARYLKMFFFKNTLLIFMHEDAFSHYRFEANNRSFEAYCEELLMRIKRTYSFFYSDQGQKTPVSQLFLAGGGAKDIELQSFLRQQLNINIQVANPFINMTYGDNLNVQQLMQDAPLYMTVCGLAQRVG